MRVAVDAMGGDHAPRELVAGALAATQADPGIGVILVGRRAEVEAEIERQGGAPPNLSVHHASDVIGMGESPVDAIKRRPDASILRALQLVRDKEADGIIAAGSTGAAVAAALMTLKRLPGVRRPGIAVPLPADNRSGVCLLIDAGANPACRPHHLHQYAIMGSSYYRGIFEVESPRVALVSIGEEETKGTHLTRDTSRLLRGDPTLQFVGNVEGRALFGGACDIAVADGFVGNIILKTAEGLAEMIMNKARTMLGERDPGAIRALKEGLDYAEFGGAPLLGVNGAVLICHGRSDARAIHNAILACSRAVDHHVNQHILRGIESREASAKP